MGDHEHDRMQGYIDKMEECLSDHAKELAVIRNVIMGNGRPGLLKMIEQCTATMQGINERLSALEHANKIVRTRNSDIWDNVKNIIYVIAFIASVGFNIFMLTRG